MKQRHAPRRHILAVERRKKNRCARALLLVRNNLALKPNESRKLKAEELLDS
jgi:hypothetical protein